MGTMQSAGGKVEAAAATGCRARMSEAQGRAQDPCGMCYNRRAQWPRSSRGGGDGMAHGSERLGLENRAQRLSGGWGGAQGHLRVCPNDM